MKDKLEMKIDSALAELINSPACPDEALVAAARAEASKKSRERSRKAAFAAMSAVLLLNAALAFLMASRAARIAGGGWAALAWLAGLTLALLPSVLLLSLGDLQKNFLQKNRS